MKALTVHPRQANSARLLEIADLQANDPKAATHLTCELIALGICGTDFEILRGEYGAAPVGSDYLILGHESLGRVLKTPPGSRFQVGDLVVGFVRHPDPVPCPSCARGEWDMCQNGLYQEHGIKELHGFGVERYYLEEIYTVKLDRSLAEVGMLLEPTSVVAKAWEQCFRIASRSTQKPKSALITGAGPIGLLAALLGTQAGLEIHVLDIAKDGLKPELVRALGARYHTDLDELEEENIDFSMTLECTGSPELILNLMNHIRPNGILCLTGVSSGGRDFATDIGQLNLQIVLQNEVIFGSVNANRRHYEAAAEALAKADLNWLKKMITRRVPFSQWQNAFEKSSSDIKTILVP